jgi:hypothetical protein
MATPAMAKKSRKTNHIGAIKLFIRHDNLARAAA